MIYSMTGFAQCTQVGEWGTISWELRTVNHRYLEISLRLPEFARSLEPEVRSLVKQSIARGKVDGHLKWHFGDSVKQELSLNLALLREVVKVNERVAAEIGTVASLRPMELFTWPDIVYVAPFDIEPWKKVLLNTFAQTLQNLLRARATEGEQLKENLLQRVHLMSELVMTIHTHAIQSMQLQRDKMNQRFAELKLELNPERLEQELVLFAQKMDVTEEIERLTAHLRAMEEALQRGKVVGRRLDFLAQELHREANTLAAKTQSVAIAQTTIELKVLIEQVREQVQNLE